MILYDIIWYYMILYDIIWYYMILYDIIWYYMILYDIIWYYMILYDIIWYYMILYDIIWYYMILYDIIWYYMRYYMLLWPFMIPTAMAFRIRPKFGLSHGKGFFLRWSRFWSSTHPFVPFAAWLLLHASLKNGPWLATPIFWSPMLGHDSKESASSQIFRAWTWNSLGDSNTYPLSLMEHPVTSRIVLPG